MKTRRSFLLPRIFLIAAAAVAICSGCSQPLRTLMDLGSEQKLQKAYVDQQSRMFELLLNDVRAERLKAGRSRSQVLARYGEPVMVKQGEAEGVRVTLLYRKPVDFVSGPKVYLDFGADDLLVAVRVEERKLEQAE